MLDRGVRHGNTPNSTNKKKSSQVLVKNTREILLRIVSSHLNVNFGFAPGKKSAGISFG